MGTSAPVGEKSARRHAGELLRFSVSYRAGLAATRRDATAATDRNAGEPTSVHRRFRYAAGVELPPWDRATRSGTTAPSSGVLGPAIRARQAATDRAVAALSAARPMLGRLLADNSIAALVPNGLCKQKCRFCRQRNGAERGDHLPRHGGLLRRGLRCAPVACNSRRRGPHQALRHARHASPPGSPQRLEEIPSLADLVAAEQGDAQK